MQKLSTTFLNGAKKEAQTVVRTQDLKMVIFYCNLELMLEFVSYVVGQR
jgi:hypothetical protein